MKKIRNRWLMLWRTAFRAVRNYTLLRLLELSLPEIRSKFDRNTSNAGMPQLEKPRLVGCQEFHRLSTRRDCVLLRQSGGLKRKPRAKPINLLRLIFSAVAFVRGH
jgi:hypothetical protein